MQKMSMSSGRRRQTQPTVACLTRKRPSLSSRSSRTTRSGTGPTRCCLAKGDWTCSVADFTGTFKGPMTTPDGKVILPNGRKFRVEFCTVAHWKNREIVEEKLFYDKISLMQQIGLM